jgi:hypothetical protein
MRTKRGEQKEETCAESLNISVATRASPLRFPQMRFGTFISFGPPGCSSANLTQDVKSENKNAGRIMLQDQKFSPLANLPRQKSRSSIHFRSALRNKGRNCSRFPPPRSAGMLFGEAEKKRNEKIK